ncbi:MAG TPA: hypothetical protein VLG76_01275 [Rhabdochlamydiaceae bacterium]|nr:hypothetical protein [Rhabdochlamydiaceae bacterium]
MRLIEEVESGELEKRCSLEELERINNFFVLLAREGLLSDDPTKKAELEKDIQELLQEDNEFSLDTESDYKFEPSVFYGDQEIVLCRSWVQKQWKHTKKFVKNHKKALIIGTAIVVAVAVVVGALAVASTAAAAGAAAGSSDQEEDEEEDISFPQPEAPVLTVTNEAPELKEALDKHLTSFKEIAEENGLLEANIENSSTLQKVKELGSYVAHDALSDIADLASVGPRLLDEIATLGVKVNACEDEPTFLENYEELIASGHDKIDQVFSTNLAVIFSPEVKNHSFRNKIIIGEIPLPLSSNLATREIAELKQAGKLEKSIAGVFEGNVTERAMRESFEKFDKAKVFLKPYSKEYITETQARELIHQAGINTFPRPKGIPENYRIKISDKGAGMLYIHPENVHTSVRVMPAKPHSPLPCHHRPYVIHNKDGKTFDKFGNIVDSSSPEAHIPLEEYIWR